MIPRPIFIVGSGRSGTSALTWALGQHPNIHLVPETNWLTALASCMEGLHRIGRVTAASHFTMFNVGLPQFLEGMGKGLDAFVRDSFERRFPEMTGVENGMAYRRSADDPKQRWVDGTPSNTPYVSFLAQMFPEAKFINLIRHPEDVFRSWAGVSWRDLAHKDPHKLLEHIYHSQRAGYLVEAALPAERTARLFFSDMTRNPEDTMRWLAEFVGEDYSPHMAEPLAHMINTTGATKPETLAEVKAIKGSELLATMLYWYDNARDDTCQISEPEEAAAELAAYAKHRIPLPN